MDQVISGVYAIKNKLTGKAYVGSSVDIAIRWQHHTRALCTDAHYSEKLQNSWNRHGQDAFEFVVLEPTVRDEIPLRAAEQVWIDALDSVRNGYNANPFAGNVGRMPKSAEHKRRIGESRRGSKHTDATKALISAKAKARPHTPNSPEQRAKISAANTGKVRTKEMRARLSEVRTGMKLGAYSPEHCAAISAGKRGKPLSDYHKQRIREGQIAARERRATQ